MRVDALLGRSGMIDVVTAHLDLPDGSLHALADHLEPR